MRVAAAGAEVARARRRGSRPSSRRRSTRGARRARGRAARSRRRSCTRRGAARTSIDVDGNRYVDLAAGFGALLLGHAPTRVDARPSRRSSERLVARARRRLRGGREDRALRAARARCSRAGRARDARRERRGRGDGGAQDGGARDGQAGRASRSRARYHGLSHGPLAACGLRAELPRAVRRAAQRARHVRAVPARRGELDASLRGRCASSLAARRRRARCWSSRSSGAAGASCRRRGFLAGAARAPATRRARSSSPTRSGRGSGAAARCSRAPPAGSRRTSSASARGSAAACRSRRASGVGERDGRVGRARRRGDPHGDALRRAARVRRGARDARRASSASDLRRAARASWARAGSTTTRADGLAGRGVREVRGRGLMVGVELDGGAARALARDAAAARARVHRAHRRGARRRPDADAAARHRRGAARRPSPTRSPVCLMTGDAAA